MKKRGRPRKRSVGLPLYESMTKCSNMTGIPVALMSWAKGKGCEAFRYARVELGLLLPFLFARLETGKLLELLSGQGELPLPNPGRTLGGRKALDEFKAQREEIKLKKELDLMVSKDEVRRDVQEAVGELFGTLERVLLNEMPPTLRGLQELDMRKRLKAELDAAKEELRRRFAEAGGGGTSSPSSPASGQSAPAGE